MRKSFFNSLKKARYILIILPCLIFFSDVNADDAFFPSKTVYFGANLGGGSTEWKYLVDTSDPADTSVSTPVSVREGGPSWGVVFGYDVSKNFAIELQYMRFADAHIHLADYGYLDQNGNSILKITSKTDAYSVSGKFFAQIAHTAMRAFAAVGAGVVERRDPLVNYKVGPSDVSIYSNYTGKSSLAVCVTPYLSSGLVYSFSRHWMLESGFQYYTGFGKAQINPVSGFIPFAWDAYGRLAYQL